MTNTTNNTFEFAFRGLQLRAFDLNGQAWFVAKDVCDMLGLADAFMSLKSMPADEKAKSDLVFPGSRGRKPLIINRAGFFRLVMRSNKPEAKEIQNWVVREVLPAIESDGMYVNGEEKVRTGEMSEDELILKAMTALQGKVSRLEREKAEQDVVIERRVNYWSAYHQRETQIRANPITYKPSEARAIHQNRREVKSSRMKRSCLRIG
ncbi:BRO-N domain-containing protein [Acuticoccus kandeliae]|uniref:BRO-N domain-containing protein n=1 Tax=Acuticoccus kandeliae TaxID=2073160 RepID=UPI001300A495|nr:BRO family protein [Acuticoccus kandeliae]